MMNITFLLQASWPIELIQVHHQQILKVCRELFIAYKTYSEVDGCRTRAFTKTGLFWKFSCDHLDCLDEFCPKIINNHPWEGDQESKTGWGSWNILLKISPVNHSDTSQSWPPASSGMQNRVDGAFLRVLLHPVMSHEQQFEKMCLRGSL